MLDYVHDIKKWLAPHILDVHGHSEPLHFKFIKDKETTKLFYKHWTTDPWSEEGIALLTVSSEIYIIIVIHVRTFMFVHTYTYMYSGTSLLQTP